MREKTIFVGRFLIVCLIMLVLVPIVEAKPTLVISTWGYNEDLLWKNLFTPFEEKYNCEIVLETGNNADRLNKIRLRQGGVDLIYLAESFAIQGIEEGLFEEINRNNIPNLEYIYDIAKAPFGEKYGPAYTIGSYGIIYNTAATDKEVTSWFDLWDEEFKNNASIPEFNTTSGPVLLFLAAQKVGVDLKENDDAAFAELAKIKDNLVKLYSRSSDLANMFAQGEIIIGAAQNFAYARIKSAVSTAKWVDPIEGAYANLNTINIVKGTKNKELAEKFINFALSTEVQKNLALDKVDSPVNINVELSPEEAEGLTYGKELIESLNTIDWQYVNAKKNEWLKRWNREIAN